MIYYRTQFGGPRSGRFPRQGFASSEVMVHADRTMVRNGLGRGQAGFLVATDVPLQLRGKGEGDSDTYLHLCCILVVCRPAPVYLWWLCSNFSA